MTVPRAAYFAVRFPPEGFALRGKYLRGGGISAADAASSSIPDIMSVSGHKSLAAVMRHFLDSSVRTCAGALVFFSRLRRSS